MLIGALLAVTLCSTGPDATGSRIGPDTFPECKGHLSHLLPRHAPPPPPLGALGIGEVDQTDVLHYDLDIEIDPAQEWIGGTNTITVASVFDGLTDFDLRVDDSFAITEVRVQGNVATWQRVSSTTITIDLAGAYDTDDIFEIGIDYAGNPDGGGFGSILFTQNPGGDPLVFTLSEPWFAHTWWPAKELNTDKATGEFRLTVPNNLSAVANGVLLDVTDVGGGLDRYHWATAYQTATYLFSFSVSNYNEFGAVYDYGTGTMPVDFFIFPTSDTIGHRNAWLECVDMLDVFGDLYGPYPFLDEKYGIYQFGFGGGMEHQTITGQGSFGESLTAHELGHQWWGDMTTCATWQDIWLNEGFATYSEALWKEFEPGSSGTPALHNHMAGRRPNSVNGSVYIPSDEVDSVNRIFSSNYSYRKAAWVLHQLRHIIGDEAFFGTLAEYRSQYAYKSATTAQFVAIAEQVHGDDLGWFFDPWLYENGAPAYRYGWQEHVLDGRRFIEMHVQQVQSASYPLFTMPLDVHVDTTGADEVHTVWNDAALEHFLFEVQADAVSIAMDPDNWTLHTSNSEASLLPGPPKIALTDPAPGAEVEAGQITPIRIVFQKGVTACDDAHFELAGDTVGPVSFQCSYDALNRAATLTPVFGLVADTYTLTVLDTLTDIPSGQALDGEVLDPADPGALPSGEGLPGGDAVIRFTAVAAAVPGDINLDGFVDVNDLVEVIVAWGPCPLSPEPCDADVNGDSFVDVNDLVAVIENWT